MCVDNTTRAFIDLRESGLLYALSDSIHSLILLKPNMVF